MNSQEILEQIENEIARLQQVKALLQGSAAGKRGVAVRPSQDSSTAARRGKRVLSEEARKKIAAAQRRRWANVRKAQTK